MLYNYRGGGGVCAISNHRGRGGSEEIQLEGEGGGGP